MATLTARSPLPLTPDTSYRHSSRRYMISPDLSVTNQSQLDDLVDDLLSDKAYMTDTGGDYEGATTGGYYDGGASRPQGSVVMPHQGSITTQSGNSRTVVSWQTQNAGPNHAVAVTTQSVTRPAPGVRIERGEGRGVAGGSRFPSVPPGCDLVDQWSTCDRYVYSSSHETKTSQSNSDLSNYHSRVNQTAPLALPSSSTPPPPVRRRIFSPDDLAGTYQSPPYRAPVSGTGGGAAYKRSLSETRAYATDSELDQGGYGDRGGTWLDAQRAKLNNRRGEWGVKREGFASARSYSAQSDTEDCRVVGRGQGRRGGEKGACPPGGQSYDSLDEINRLLSESTRELTETWERQQQQTQQQQQKQQQQKQTFRTQVQAPPRRQQASHPPHPVRSSSVGANRRGPPQDPPEPCFFVSGIERPAFSTHQTKYVFSVSPSPSRMLDEEGAWPGDETPPTCASPVAPRRGDSSREAVLRSASSAAAAVDDELDRSLAKLMEAQPQGNEWMTEKVVEEEVISLEPIGRGIQVLEPDTGTLPRTLTRAVSPVYPGFPVPGYRSPSLGRSSPPPVRGGYTTPTPTSPRTLPRATTPLPISPGSTTLSGYSSPAPGGGSSLPPAAGSKGGLMAAGAGAPFSKEDEDLEAEINAMMASALSPANSASTASQQQLGMQGGRPQVVGLTQTTVTRTQTSTGAPPPPAAAPLGHVVEPKQQSGYLQQQEKVLKQQQLLLQQSQQLQQLQQQQLLLKQQEQNLQQKQQQALQQQQQQQQLQQQQQSQPGWTMKEETIVKTFSTSERPTVTSEVTSSMAAGQGQGQAASAASLKLQQLQQQQQQLQQGTTAEGSQRSTVQSVQQASSFQRQAFGQQTTSSSAGAVQAQTVGAQGEVTASSALSGSSGMREQQYASVTPREARGATPGGLGGADTAASKNGVERAPSPSQWTTDTLRSYTARQHSASPSPLFHPGGGTLPSSGGAAAGRASPSVYFGQSRTGSLTSFTDGDTLTNTPRFVRDTSKYWHRPNISRDEAIATLRDLPPGSFVVRNSSTFHGAYGLALKVAQVPPNVQSKGGDPQTELVRHFLIEPTARGVRLKGCSNEPVFGSLAALVYQHTLTPLALPCKLLLPETDEVRFGDTVDSGSNALTQGAACNVLYVNSVDTESLTGPAALSKAIQRTFGNNHQPKTTLVQFKVSTEGITLTDNQRSVFFRRHYPLNSVTFCGIDENERRWTPSNGEANGSVGGRVFGFVARRPGSAADNSCHLFVEADPGQPASAIVDFLTQLMINQGMGGIKA